jgi:hypothetical protein
MAHAFYATRLSDKLSKTPEGFLIAKDVVLGRTGYQTYNVRDLPKAVADEMGIDTSDPAAEIDLYRAEDEVFDPATIASFEGKPVTDNHPGDGFVSPSNFNEHARGHVQNVHRGSEPLESGDLPLMGDIMITVDSLIRKVEGGLRQLSCGYDYSLGRDGGKLLQTGIRGNHVAVVPQGRAGAEARIYDSAPEQQIAEDAPAPLEAPGGEIKTTKKEKLNVLNVATTTKQPTNPNWFRRVVFGLGLRAMAQDENVKPEELAEAASAVSDAEEEEEEKKPFPPAEDRKARDRKARDKKADDRKADDSRAADDDPDDDDDEGPAEDRRADDRRADDRRADDRKADDRKADDGRHINRGRGGWQHKDSADAAADASDHRGRMHATLDRILDEMLPGEEEGSTEDADMEELRNLLSEYMGEEAGEPEHQDALPPEGEEQPLEQMVGDEGNEAEIIEPPNARTESSGPTHVGDRSRAADAAEFAFLNRMKRLAIKANDTAGVREITQRLQRYTRSPRPVPANGGYGGFQEAASRTRAGDSTLAVNGQADLAKLQATYDRVLRGKPVEEGK